MYPFFMAKLTAYCFSYWCVMKNIKDNCPEYFKYRDIQSSCNFLEDNANTKFAKLLYRKGKLYAYNEMTRIHKRGFKDGVIHDVGIFTNFCPVCDHALFWRRCKHGIT